MFVSGAQQAELVVQIHTSTLFQILFAYRPLKVKVTQPCPTLCDPYTVHGILQAQILEWVAFPFSKVSSQPRDGTQVFCIAGGFFTRWATREAHIGRYRALNTVPFAIQFSSVIQSRLTLCNPMDYSKPGFPVHHQLPELAQTHVHWGGDAIYSLILCCPFLLLPSIFLSIRVFYNESVLLIRWPKYWSFSFSISPSNECW